MNDRRLIKTRNWLNAIYYKSRKIYFCKSIEIMNIYVMMYISWDLSIVFVLVHNNGTVVACIPIYKSLFDSCITWWKEHVESFIADFNSDCHFLKLKVRPGAGDRCDCLFSFLEQWQYQWQFMMLCSSVPIHTYVYGAWSLTRVHLSSVIQLRQICIMYSIITVYALHFRMASMPAARYHLNEGLPPYLWYDSLYIRDIW